MTTTASDETGSNEPESADRPPAGDTDRPETARSDHAPRETLTRTAMNQAEAALCGLRDAAQRHAIASCTNQLRRVLGLPTIDAGDVEPADWSTVLHVVESMRTHGESCHTDERHRRTVAELIERSDAAIAELNDECRAHLSQIEDFRAETGRLRTLVDELVIETNDWRASEGGAKLAAEPLDSAWLRYGDPKSIAEAERDCGSPSRPSLEQLLAGTEFEGWASAPDVPPSQDTPGLGGVPLNPPTRVRGLVDELPRDLHGLVTVDDEPASRWVEICRVSPSGKITWRNSENGGETMGGRCRTEVRMPHGGALERCPLDADHAGTCPPVEKLQRVLAHRSARQRLINDGTLPGTPLVEVDVGQPAHERLLSEGLLVNVCCLLDDIAAADGESPWCARAAELLDRLSRS